MSLHTGKRAELVAQLWLTQRGMEVLSPVLEYGPTDIMWRRLGHDGVHTEWRSAQVKAVYDKGGHPTINLVRSDGKRYYPTDANFLIAVSDTHIWLIPFHLVCNKSRMRMTGEWDRFKFEYHAPQEFG